MVVDCSCRIVCVVWSVHTSPHSRLIVGGADLSPEKESAGDRDTVYSFSWITNGYSKTKSGSREVVPFTFALDGMNVVCKLQAKFYEYGNGQHLTWGQPVSAIELICSSDPASTSGAAALDTSPLEVKFKWLYVAKQQFVVHVVWIHTYVHRKYSINEQCLFVQSCSCV